MRLAKLKGLPKHTFHLYLNEIEWRYNCRHMNKYKTLNSLAENLERPASRNEWRFYGRPIRQAAGFGVFWRVARIFHRAIGLRIKLG